jgi:phospholipid transport system substrate-binding protein
MTNLFSPAPWRAFTMALSMAGTPALAHVPVQPPKVVPATAQAPDRKLTNTQAPLTDPATKQIRGFYDTLLESMQHAQALGMDGRYKKLEPAIDKAFDFPGMTQMIIGPNWAAMSEADKTALTSAFRRMTIADYAHNFDGYGGEAFTVDPQVIERKGDKVVRSKLVLPGKAPIPFVYRMTKTAQGWQILDIFLNGYVSEVATRRADFASTLRKGGASALAAKLNAMTDAMLKGK